MAGKENKSRATLLSKAEIAKKFDLPERKSKIATLLKQDGQTYCFCRTSDSSRFMIGCDSCEEWYHGDCIGINQKEAKFIKKYYCPRCREEDPTLETKLKPGSKLENDKERFTVDKEKPKKKKDPHATDKCSEKKKTKTSCGQCSNCLRNEICGNCQTCKDAKRFTGTKREKCFKQICLKFPRGNVPMGRRGRRPVVAVCNEEKSEESDSEDEQPPCKVTGPQQCFGPGCTKENRANSKYCSHECGMKLASNRILQILPQRLQEWGSSTCIAEAMNRQQLELIRQQQREVQVILQELDKRHKELDSILDRAKTSKIKLSKVDYEEEGEMSMYCITCGHEIHSRTAIKHMEKCFNKYESQASFGSIYKTRIDGNNMFCDFFNPANHTYCKRLKVLCPEHCKDPKVTETEVCGCPLVTNVFDLTGKFCRQPKKTCLKHYCWEKLRRAEIDMERVRQWMKIDELIEEERQIRQNMSDRAGVLALMLHSTHNHVLMEAQLRAVLMDPELEQNNSD